MLALTEKFTAVSSHIKVLCPRHLHDRYLPLLVIRRCMTATRFQIREENCSMLAISLVPVSN